MNTAQKLIIFIFCVALVGLAIWLPTKRENERITTMTKVIEHQLKLSQKLILIEVPIDMEKSFKDFRYYDTPMLQREITLCANGHAGIGYDMSNTTYTVDTLNKIIYIRGMPEPTVLYTDFETNFCSESYGILTKSFTKEELNYFIGEIDLEINTYISRDKSLFLQAETHMNQIYLRIQRFVSAYDWALVHSNSTL